MKNKITSFLVIFGFLCIFSLPVLVFAQNTWNPSDSIVVCRGDRTDCGWGDLVVLINRIISFLLYLATILAVIAFVFAGFKLLLSGGSESAAKEAKDIFFKVTVGLVFAYGAWILVYFILSALGVQSKFDLIT